MLRAAFPTCLLGSHSLSGHFLLDLESAHHRLLKTPERNHGPQWRLLTLKGTALGRKDHTQSDLLSMRESMQYQSLL